MLKKKYPNEFEFSVSCTTRAPRPLFKGSQELESDGVHYIFLSKEEFEKKIKNNEFLEYAQVHDKYYGTLKSTIERIQKGKKMLYT